MPCKRNCQTDGFESTEAGGRLGEGEIRSVGPRLNLDRVQAVITSPIRFDRLLAMNQVHFRRFEVGYGVKDNAGCWSDDSVKQGERSKAWVRRSGPCVTSIECCS